MAVRERPAGFRGGVSRWVPREETRAIAKQIDALAKVGDLVAWCEAAPVPLESIAAWVPCARLPLFGGDPDTALTEADRLAIAATAVVSLADRRRRDSIREYLREHELDQAGGAQSLARCPNCDAAIDATVMFRLYCREPACEAVRDAEVALLLEAES